MSVQFSYVALYVSLGQRSASTNRLTVYRRSVLLQSTNGYYRPFPVVIFFYILHYSCTSILVSLISFSFIVTFQFLQLVC